MGDITEVHAHTLTHSLLIGQMCPSQVKEIYVEDEDLVLWNILVNTLLYKMSNIYRLVSFIVVSPSPNNSI